MARPRTVSAGLPTNVYFKHGAYYHAQGGRWTKLTRNREHVEAALLSLVARVPASMEAVAAYALRLLPRSRANAKGRRGLPHSLSQDDVMRMLWKAKWRCAVTGTPFSLVEIGPKRQRPYAPSIDRIDNALGYNPENCRVVCVLANFAMNTWGAEALRHVAQHMRTSQFFLDNPDGLLDNAEKVSEISTT